MLDFDMKQRVHPFWIASSVVLCCLTATNSTQAQIVPDSTLPNNSSVSTGENNSTITGGTVAGNNLFHSFDVFSVPTGNTAYFNNAPEIQNIISRVTGSSISNIDGLIRANNTANLFLINPNGIIFGSNASLNIGGSFIASTASSLNFADGNSFSAAHSTTPLLTVSVPTGLQFGVINGSIRNQSIASGIDITGTEVVTGLQVKPDKTLALIGGDLVLEGGYLTAQQGRIELGSVAQTGQVSLNPTEKGWAFGYEDVQNFRDIQLSQSSNVDTSGERGGEIQIQGRRVSLTEGSQINSLTYGSEPGGTLTVNASDAVELSGTSSSGLPSILSTIAFSEQAGAFVGKAGDIKINTGKLIVQNQAAISSAGQTGQGGNLTVNASDFVELVNGFLDAQTLGIGNAGDLTIATRRLIVRNGGQVSAASNGQGNGGSILIDASNAVNLFGVGFDSGLSSGLFTKTFNGGQGGNITVKTLDFRVADGALVDALTQAQGNGGQVTINARTFEAINGGQVVTNTRSSGNAGKISLNVSDSTTLAGSDRTFDERVTQFGRDFIDNEGSASGLFANTALGSTGDGGSVTLTTGQLNVQDGATATVSSQGIGNAGNLEVTANSIRLGNGGKLLSTSTFGIGGGDITLNSQDLLLLRNKGEISTSAGGSGKGGNINIDTDLLVGTENSDITANAFEREGGFIQITSEGIFGLEIREQLTENSDITAFSQKDPSLNGVVEINRPDIDPSTDLVILPAQIIDISGLVAQGCGAGGNLAKGTSELVVTGRGGLPPTPTEATRSDTTLVDLGAPILAGENRLSAEMPSNTNTNSDSTTLVEAQGWVIGSKGEVILTANPPTVTPDIPWLMPTSCNRS